MSLGAHSITASTDDANAAGAAGVVIAGATVRPTINMQVIVPAGVGPGQPFVVATPGGLQFQVVAPPGVMPGMQIMVEAPTDAPVPVVQARAVTAVPN